MKLESPSKISIPGGRMLLVCGIVIGLMAALGAAVEENAQNKDVCTGAEMGNYAKLVFCLPPEVVVEPETMAEANYTEGREVAASMLLDGNRVGLHLLYPCQAPQQELQPPELKPYLEGYDPLLAQATYNESVPGPLLWGQIGNQMFIAYQPNNQTIALILMDMNMSESMMTTFLGNLSIAVNEGIAPPSNCPDTTNTALMPSSEEAAAVQGEAANATATENTATEIAAPESQATAAAENLANEVTSGQENAASGIDAARARLEEMKKNMKMNMNR
jgi:hypothetical protein